jgi:hypothetical protein
VFYCLFCFFLFVFLSLFISPLPFPPCFVSVFRFMQVSSLAYPNLLGTKCLVVVVVVAAILPLLLRGQKILLNCYMWIKKVSFVFRLNDI